MKMTADQQLIKKINKTLVLDTIRVKQPLSRADIATALGLNKATVSSLVAELIEARLVHEIGPGESSGGRKPTLLLFHRGAGYSIGIDLRVQDILAVLVDLEGNIIREKRVPLKEYSPEYVIKEIRNTIRSLSKNLPETPYGIVGVGIGVPGLVDEKNRVVSAPNLNWHQVSLDGIVPAELGQAQLIIDNEANAGAIGEKLFGAGRDTANMIYLSIGIGIGSGIIVDGQLYRGVSNFSGEVGHMTITADGPVCRCGNRGCWETLASEKALLDLARTKRNSVQTSTSSEPDLELIVEQARNGHLEAVDVLNEIGNYLGVGLANLVNILNPELIVIGNRLSLAGEQLEKSMLSTVESRSLTYHRQKTSLAFAKLGVYSTALGAASMPITSFLMDPVDPT